jgi:hypothetical protein
MFHLWGWIFSTRMALQPPNFRHLPFASRQEVSEDQPNRIQKESLPPKEKPPMIVTFFDSCL